MPIFSRLVETGCSGVVAAGGLDATAFWATLATGLMPEQHGIAHAAAERPDRGGVGPVSAGAWRGPPLWALLASRNIPAILVGGPGSAPAIGWPGCVVVDERFAPAPAGPGDWPLPPDCVAPSSLRPALRPLRMHPDELADADRAGLPAGPLAETVGLHAAATGLAGQLEWQCLTVHHGLLTATRADAAYVFADAMLESLLTLAGPGADLVVVSPEGVLIAAGPGFAADFIVHGAGPADIHATMLARFGFRQEGAPGRILAGTRQGALESLPAQALRPQLLPTSLLLPGAAGAAAIAAVGRESAMRLAMAAVGAQDFAAAAGKLREILRQAPNDTPALLLLGQCVVFLGLWDEAATIGRDLVLCEPELPWGHLLCGAALALGGDEAAAAAFLDRAERLGGDDPLARVRLGAVALQCGLLQTAHVHYAAALALDGASSEAQAGLGLTAAASGNAAEAERRLRLALGLKFHAPALHHQLGAILAAKHRWREAAASLRTALAQQPGLAGAADLLRQVATAAVDPARDRQPGAAASGLDRPQPGVETVAHPVTG